MQDIDFENFIKDTINEVNLEPNNREMILKNMSHQILKWAVADIEFVKTNIIKNIPVESESITDRLLFQFFDCIFRESTSWEIEKCVSRLSDNLEAFNEYKSLPSHLMYSGALHMLKGERDLAYKFYSASSFLANTYYLGLPRMYLGANSVVTTTRDWIGSSKKLPAVQKNIKEYFLKQNTDSHGLVLFAADVKYFENFKDFVVGNLKDINSETPVHFHIVDCEGTYKKLSGCDDGDFTIGYSHEYFKYFRDKTYFATSRFYRALEILNKYDKSIYISDIDNKFIHKPDDFFKKVKDFDVGLRFNTNGNWFPWWGPSAGSLYAANTEMGKTFLRHLNEYISERFKVNQLRYTWWFDQLAINDVYHYCKENYPEMKFVNLNDHEYLLSVIRHDDELQSLKSK